MDVVNCAQLRGGEIRRTGARLAPLKENTEREKCNLHVTSSHVRLWKPYNLEIVWVDDLCVNACTDSYRVCEIGLPAAKPPARARWLRIQFY